MRLFCLLLLPASIASFTVLPYIQIDYAHYFRLAQCQAKCAEKYGNPSKKELNDGSVEEFIESRSEDAKACGLGCQQHRRGHRKHPRSAKSVALQDGTRFWLESSADSAKIGTSPVASVELLCQNPTHSEDLEDSAEGFVGLRLHRPVGAVKYVLQWKQRTYALGFYDESQWITASIESSSVFRVDGLIPSVQYKFMVTAVGPNGRLGNTVSSDWAEVAAVGSAQKAPGGPLTARTGYNDAQGATAQLHWPRTTYDSCFYRLQYSNTTHHTLRDFTVDPSISVLLRHLEFDSLYSVTLSALNAEKEQPTRAVSTQFKAIECRRVYGRDSLQCEPESVSNLKVVVRSNGSATVSWKPSVAPEAILFYQLEVEPLQEQCSQDAARLPVNAGETSHSLQLSGVSCEYLIRLINYDLLGREASTETRVSVSSLAAVALLPWQAVAVASALALLALLCAFLRCLCRHSRRVAEKEAKLTDSYA